MPFTIYIYICYRLHLNGHHGFVHSSQLLEAQALDKHGVLVSNLEEIPSFPKWFLYF